jgi:hypothetical protein
LRIGNMPFHQRKKSVMPDIIVVLLNKT